MPATLYLIFGPCGAGKPTYAYAPAARARSSLAKRPNSACLA